MFIDRASIVIKAGNGGNGKVSFHTQKYIANGGPDGGDGGRGGDIIFTATKDLNTLIDFKFARFFRADNGMDGDTKKCYGKSANPLIIKVPCGTVIKDKSTGQVIADLFYDGQEQIIAKGGRGGLGNAMFATSTRQSPNFAQHGIITKEYEVLLELKLIADVGIIGCPNAGKSTLLSVISNAKPKIADYHFTTLSPNLGVVKHYETSFVAPDIPGLIEGAAEGVGLGHEFLRHTERTRLLIHVVDVAGLEGREPYDDYVMINNELNSYSDKMSKLRQVIALNKKEFLKEDEAEKIRKQFIDKTGNEDVFLISAASNQGVKELLNSVIRLLAEIPYEEVKFESELSYNNEVDNSFTVDKVADNYFVVSGGLIDNLARLVILSDPDSLSYFQKSLRNLGINAALKQAGIKEGDTVKMVDMEFDYFD